MSHHVHKVEYDEVIEQSPCSDVYKLVQKCLDEHNRDWAACQAPVAQWKQCFAKRSAK